MLKKLSKMLYLVVPGLLLLIFVIDLLSYYSNITITVIAYTRELIIFGIIYLCFLFLKRKIHPDQLSLDQNLFFLSLLIVANYLIKLFLNLVFNARYSSDFPPVYNSTSAIIVSTILAIFAAITLVPVIFILKELIFYKRKRYTGMLFTLLLLSIGATGISVFLTRQPIEFRFISDTISNDIFMVINISLMIFLSFRNDWITYLSRKKKIIYSLAGTIFLIGIGGLFDFVYKKTIPAYSLLLATYTYNIWLFLVIYSSVAVIKLWFQLPTARSFERKMRELNALYDFGRKLSTQMDYKKLLSLITELTAQILESESTWLEIYAPEDQKFTIVASLNLAEEKIKDNPFNGFQSLTTEIMRKKGPILINDIPHNKYYQYIYKWNREIRSLMAAPLYSNREQLMGIIYATKSKTYQFDVDHLSLIEGIANQAAMALENVQLLKESIERERLQQELKVARDVQLKLLPQEIPQIPNFEIDAFSLPAYEVGGDYYDFFQFADGNPGLIIGDVSGKGTSAALYMAEFKGIIQTLARKFTSPYELIVEANRVIYPNIERRYFVSAIVAKIDLQNARLIFVRAGHPPPIICSDHERNPISLLTPGLGLGLDQGGKFNAIVQEKAVPLSEGNVVIFYTDGLTEARNDSGEEFTEHRLIELLRKCNFSSAQALKDFIFDEVTRFCESTPLHDDMTLIILKRN